MMEYKSWAEGFYAGALLGLTYGYLLGPESARALALNLMGEEAPEEKAEEKTEPGTAS